VMGWHVAGATPSWRDDRGGDKGWATQWHPSTNRNQLAMVEARLTQEQRLTYIDALQRALSKTWSDDDVRYGWYMPSSLDFWNIRTADPAVCLKVLKESWDEQG